MMSTGPVATAGGGLASLDSTARPTRGPKPLAGAAGLALLNSAASTSIPGTPPPTKPSAPQPANTAAPPANPATPTTTPPVPSPLASSAPPRSTPSPRRLPRPRLPCPRSFPHHHTPTRALSHPLPPHQPLLHRWSYSQRASKVQMVLAASQDLGQSKTSIAMRWF
ncbi:hypothetical protein C2845_PM13G23140 [Panicum miliaceum]|uniref:Uncharacterized protein n=1 Tax=Panicum miliaceum TaxID=4540 RepID=A0A3L6RIJ8_PANMI|nr:hypothetical protein C2845_PM13G23140 [Panicum miliaceum]